MKYEIIYTKTVTRIVECNHHTEIFGVADENCPDGFAIEDWAWIKDDEHLSHVLEEMKAQQLTNQTT